MAKRVVWSAKAKASFKSTIQYLQKEWTANEVEAFIESTEEKVQLILSGKVKFRQSQKKNLREVLITKHNLLIYRETKTRLEIVYIYNTRQHPMKRKRDD